MRRQIREIVEAVKGGFRTDAMRDELLALEARKAEIAGRLKVPQLPALHPNMAAEFRRCVQQICDGLQNGAIREASQREDFRRLIEKIEVAPGESSDLMVHGHLGAMLEMAAGRPLPPINPEVAIVGCGGGI